jgi:hypothetical protein
VTAPGRLLVAGAAALLLAGCTAASAAEPEPAPIGHAEFRFVGEWTGDLDGAGEGITGMVVASAAADGTTFDGDLTFVARDATSTETVHAVMTPHGHLVAGIGEDASVEAHIVDPDTLDYCFIRYGFEPVYSCGRLARVD